jgi:hypothetical protein
MNIVPQDIESLRKLVREDISKSRESGNNLREIGQEQKQLEGPVRLTPITPMRRIKNSASVGSIGQEQSRIPRSIIRPSEYGLIRITPNAIALENLIRIVGISDNKNYLFKKIASIFSDYDIDNKYLNLFLIKLSERIITDQNLMDVIELLITNNVINNDDNTFSFGWLNNLLKDTNTNIRVIVYINKYQFVLLNS